MEQKQKYVSYESVDQAIFELDQALLRSLPRWETEQEFTRAEYDHKQIMSAIKYYILTDRAPLDFMRRFVNLNAREFGALARRCWKSSDKSTRSIIDVCKRYLKTEEASA